MQVAWHVDDLFRRARGALAHRPSNSWRATLGSSRCGGSQLASGVRPTVSSPVISSHHTEKSSWAAQAFWEALDGHDALTESSSSGGALWHLNTRTGQTDWAGTDRRAYLDFSKGPDMLAAACKSLDTPGPPLSLSLSLFLSLPLSVSVLNVQIWVGGGTTFSPRGLTTPRRPTRSSTWLPECAHGMHRPISRRQPLVCCPVFPHPFLHVEARHGW